jgi:hypothetical protein
MKLQTITGIVATVTLFIALGTVAHAQNPAQPGQGGKLRQGRPGRNPGDKASDRLLREANQRIERAQRLMKNALPIYDGHRANAIELSQIAQWEIKIGLAWDRYNEQGKGSPASAKSSEPKEGKRGPGHTAEQVQRSNQQLMAAGKLLEDALALIGQAQRDYNGHRAKAGEATRKAIQQLKEALQSV